MLIQDLFKNKQMEFVKGYAETKSVKSYVFLPRNIDECLNLLENCKMKGLKICSRGGGLSYGDIITNEDNVIIDLTLINKILSWNDETGIMIVQPGTTFAQIYNISLLNNWTLSACPGSSDITIGGSISNNVHGKDCFKNGSFGNQVLEFKLLLASGTIINVGPKKNYDLFRAVIGGMGLLGIIVEIKLKLKRIPSPFVIVKNKISENIFKTIDYIEERKENYDFSVAWTDCFATNNSLGRGFVTSAKWKDSNKKIDKNELNKSFIKSKRIYGILPAKKTWYFSRPFFKPYSIKKLNFLNFYFHKIRNAINDQDNQTLLFTKYNFMHNQIPDLKHVYRPEGFLELQPILPKKNIKNKLKELILLCQKLNAESLLCGIKIHSSNNCFLSFDMDGYSIGITLQLKGRKKEDVVSLSNEIYSFIADCKGKINLAKDEYLNKYYFKKMYPKYLNFLQIKNKFDPQGVFTSDLHKRLF